MTNMDKLLIIFASWLDSRLMSVYYLIFITYMYITYNVWYTWIYFKNCKKTKTVWKKSSWETYSQVGLDKNKLQSVLFIQNFPIVLLPGKSSLIHLQVNKTWEQILKQFYYIVNIYNFELSEFIEFYVQVFQWITRTGHLAKIIY